MEKRDSERSMEHFERHLTWFREARDRNQLNAETVRQTATAAVAEFFAALEGGTYLGQAIALIIEIATLSDRHLSRLGLRALFPELIERLNDSFDPAACATHDQIMAQVIDYCRHLPEGQPLDRALNCFGLATEADLLARKESLSVTSPQSNRHSVKKIILLSRVTIGADVAVTSVILGRLKSLAPEADLVWIGPRKLAELYAGDRRLRLHPADYDRGGHLLDRLLSWLPLQAAIEEESKGLGEGDLWVVDPDSRMTQLGILPVLMEDRHYYHFESRCFRAPGCDRLSQLAARWCDEQWGSMETPDQAHPFVALTEEQIALGEEVVSRLRGGRTQKVVCLSFGVGGNSNKRVSEEFEERLLLAIASRFRLLIDKGGSPEEHQTVERMIDRLREAGKRVVEAREGVAVNDESNSIDLMTWEGGIGSFAALVRASDQYVGYDSAGQHIAAAQGIPTLTIFVNSSSPLFAARWHPAGPGVIKVFPVLKNAVPPDDLTESIIAQL
jgi:ADP-heptose:LPS heptosyltransferase